jgi:ABC-type bacteriocin/lantibiotic exporter with double-glycine peptidase domain
LFSKGEAVFSHRYAIKVFFIIIWSHFFSIISVLSFSPLLAGEEPLGKRKGAYYIDGVPFYPQEENYCGPASLSSILNFYGRSFHQEEIAQDVFNAKLKGALTVDLLNFAKKSGFNAKFYRGSIENVKKNIEANRPLILFLNLGSEFLPVRHYLVVVGFDENEEHLITYSGREKNRVYPLATLLKAWKKTGYGTLQVFPQESDFIM